LTSNNTNLKWAAGGWIFFVGENFVLSENRTYLIDLVGDDKYHLLYGTFSTIATASIGYSYIRLSKMVPTVTKAVMSPKSLPMSRIASSWALLTIGVNMAAQAIPKLQIPLGMSTGKLEVRCPFDFSDKKQSNNNDLQGLERISRHPGLWSLAFLGMGHGLLIPLSSASSVLTLPLQVWWMGPTLVASIGGSHTDSRFRRNMGGSLTPEYESKTSNVPFMAMLAGRQGPTVEAFQDMLSDVKPLNSLLATAGSTAWVTFQVVKRMGLARRLR